MQRVSLELAHVKASGAVLFLLGIKCNKCSNSHFRSIKSYRFIILFFEEEKTCDRKKIRFSKNIDRAENKVWLQGLESSLSGHGNLLEALRFPYLDSTFILLPNHSLSLSLSTIYVTPTFHSCINSPTHSSYIVIESLARGSI